MKNCLKFICSYLHSIIRLHGHYPSHSKYLKPYRRKNHSLRTEDAKRGTLLTDFEMGKITGLHEDGKSVTEIADALGRSYNCIGNFLKRKRPYTHGGGHQEKLNERKRQIVRALSVRDPPSLRKLITQLKFEVSEDTIRKFLQ